MKGEGSTSSVQGIQNSAAIAIAALLFALLFLATAPSAHADTLPCGNPSATATGYFFSDYESDEYVDGLLVRHFKINPPYTEGRTFKLTWYYHDDACNNAFNFYGSNTLNVTMPAGITDWSIRYATPAHFDVWDDIHNTIIAQADVGAFPSYTSAQFLGSIDGGASFLTSRTLKIQEDGQPPVFTGTLAKDPNCPSMIATGYYFDPTFEHAEYVDHLLRVHLRVLSPYNDGRLIWMQMLSVDASCNRDASIPWLFSMPRATIPAHIRYFSFRMTSPTHWVLWNDENDTQIICSFGALGCEGDIAEGTPYVSLYGNIDQNATTLFTTPYAPVEVPQGCTENCNSNVLFLPGIEASRLYRPARQDEAPDTEKRAWEPQNDVDAAYLNLGPDGMPGALAAPIYTRDVISEAYGTFNVYASFIGAMNDLRDNKHLINAWEAAPYDWRLSLDQVLNSGAQTGQNISYVTATNTPYVEQELRKLASSSRTGKVTIIAHSNGGLVAKALMQKLGTTTTAELIDKVIFVAVPQVGTPAAVAGLLHGYDQGITFKVSDSAMRELGNNSPAAYNLLPSFNYFTYVDDPVATFDPVTLPEWATLYGDSIHSQERLHAFGVSGFERVPVGSTDTITPVQLNDTLLTKAEDTHVLLDNWAPPAGVQVIQIAGWGIPTTLKGIEYASTSKSVFCSGICVHGLGLAASTTIDGDGTVVVPSALWMSATTGAVNYWVDLNEYNRDHPFLSAFGPTKFMHARILETEPVLSIIESAVIGSSVTPNQYIFMQEPTGDGVRLRYSLHSPLTLSIYDDQGRHTGVSTTTGQVEEQVPGTYYMEFGEVKYIFTDASTTAHIVMEGYDTGTFTFNVDEYTGDSLTASTTFQDIPTIASTIVTMSVQSDISTLSPMRIDANGDGTVDRTLAPKPDGIVTLDTTPPEIQITFATSTNALTFIGIDDMGTTTISATTSYPALKRHQKEPKGIATTTVIAWDEQGNTTALIYTEKLPSPEKRETIFLEEIAYNGATTTLSNTSVSYKWRTDKHGLYKLFASHIKTSATSTESHYRPKKDQTVIMTKPQDFDDSDDDDSDIRPIKQTIPGMVVPYMRTEEGRVIIGY